MHLQVKNKRCRQTSSKQLKECKDIAEETKEKKQEEKNGLKAFSTTNNSWKSFVGIFFFEILSDARTQNISSEELKCILYVTWAKNARQNRSCDGIHILSILSLYMFGRCWWRWRRTLLKFLSFHLSFCFFVVANENMRCSPKKH